MANLVSSWGNLIYMPLTVSAHRGFLEGTGTPLCAYAEGGSRRQGGLRKLPAAWPPASPGQLC